MKSERRWILSFLLVVGVLASGCDDSAIIWTAEAQSPDQQFVASARTEQYGGPGTAGIVTTVFLKQGAQSPTMILELANESAYPAGATAVTMRWITPTHLSIAYQGHAAIDFQVVKCAGVDVSLEKKS